MDIRGVEITNQLRSAIRAKLLELGVRYDEELPDYILVMVVNKKSRQQMSEDLHLFLEDSTESFVAWLHDQVLKKLQKVTVAKKKTVKDINPSIVVKKEEDEKKFKVEKESDTPPLKPPETTSKQDRDREFEELVGDLALLNEDDTKLSSKETIDEGKLFKRKSAGHTSDFESRECSAERKTNFSSDSSESISTKARKKSPSPKSLVSNSSKNQDELSVHDSRKTYLDSVASNSKELPSLDEIFEEKKIRSKHAIESRKSENRDNRPKSSTSKPKITSVVSVKSRLGALSPSKKSESLLKSDDHQNNSKSHLDVRRKDADSRSSSHQGKSIDSRKRTRESRRERSREARSHSGNRARNEKSSKMDHSRDLVGRPNSKKTIKSRLGVISPHKKDELSLASSSTKASQPKTSNVKSRLGIKVKDSDDEVLDLRRLPELDLAPQHFENEGEDSADSEFTSSLRSHIIAVKKLKSQKAKRKISKESKRTGSDEDILKELEDDEDDDSTKVPSKVIVTPRPLKPLQPFQKRATQSLLLRAVAEANQSVVMRKKVDPCLKERKKKSGGKVKVTREVKKGKIVSVSLKSKKKRSAIEKIQVELANANNVKSTKAHSSKRVSDEDLHLMKSLFQRSDNKQKFLVTLNGYNNNLSVEKNSDEEDPEEIQEDVEVLEDYDEDDDLDLENNQYDFYSENDQMLDDQEYMYDGEDDQDLEMVEQETIPLRIQSRQLSKHKIDNDKDEDQELDHLENSERKRRRISPIVYARSRSSSPAPKPTSLLSVSSLLSFDKRPVMNSVISTLPDKSAEKCRYWPNCTLGMKCAYYHPEVPCSSFPACKFGEKCAYQHPKCKFGSACTKLGCIFSHPPVQCKYHPYCMKPGCQFSHPKTPVASLTTSLTSIPPLPPDPSILRAKFTWKKKD
ncbi:hypothetical protein QAD02_001883 [Eretmocerus hayati]|uniref:Uncharacterized protein n=1 Tax=Eretmocerus hayati TaxID=131215 RepID=A0ACC2NJZ5_9HYME|nr:hypothetical protein QAD02_001883 [Eretmocerus hayati]